MERHRVAVHVQTAVLRDDFHRARHGDRVLFADRDVGVEDALAFHVAHARHETYFHLKRRQIDRVLVSEVQCQRSAQRSQR